MNEFELKKKLYLKMGREFENFLKDIRNKSFETFIDNSYEISIKNEILSMFYIDNDYSVDQIKLLLNCNNPLEKIYDGMRNEEIGLYEVLISSIDNTLNQLEKNKEKNKLER